MKKPEPSICDPQQIVRFLRGELSEDDQVALEQHLDHCESCQGSLNQQTADGDLWDKAGLYLRDDDGELKPLSDLTTNPDETHDQMMASHVLDSLAPTDDPQMLGRVDGYEISGVIGCGGMGAVLKGFDRSLNRVVAIKVMSPHLATSGAARKRFSREAQAAAAITHDNVIEIYGVAEANNLPYLVMPYARGTNLQKRIDGRGPFPVVEILRIGSQIAAGLAAAHQQGLVHRDIKPANILLSDGIDRLVITDFGLARAVDDASVTRTGVIAGTPQYMSPEQARGGPIDHRSDLFSLGSVLYTMCTGRIPFRADSAYGMLRRITDDDPRPIREVNPEIPVWLSQLVGKLHAKSPDDRYQTADEVASLLQQCVAHVQTANKPLPVELRPAPHHGNWMKAACFLTGAVAVSAIMFLINRNAVDHEELPGQQLATVEPSLSERNKIDSYVDEPALMWNDDFQPSAETVAKQASILAAQTRTFFSNLDSPTNQPSERP